MSNKLLQLIFSLYCLSILYGCENFDYSKTDDGLVYRIISTGDGEKIKSGSYLKLHQSLEVGDSLFYETFGRIAAYGRFDTSSTPTHDFLDILDKMRVGDSAIVLRSIDTLEKRQLLSFNEVFRKGKYMKVKIKVLASYDSEEELKAIQSKDFEAYKKVEALELKKWVDQQNLSGVKSLPEGILIYSQNNGTGIQVDTGMTVTMNYTGRLLNGNVFDSNLDSSFGHKEPFKFIVGSREVIEGWDIAAKNLRVGEKAKVFIPSLLGYGTRGAPPKIPANSHLIFEMEVLSAEFIKPTEQIKMNAPINGVKPNK